MAYLRKELLDQQIDLSEKLIKLDKQGYQKVEFKEIFNVLGEYRIYFKVDEKELLRSLLDPVDSMVDIQEFCTIAYQGRPLNSDNDILSHASPIKNLILQIRAALDKKRSDIYRECRAAQDIVRDDVIFNALRNLGFNYSNEIKELAHLCHEPGQQPGLINLKKIEFLLQNCDKISDKKALSHDEAKFLDQKFAVIRQAFIDTHSSIEGAIAAFCHPMNGTISSREMLDILEKSLKFEASETMAKFVKMLADNHDRIEINYLKNELSTTGRIVNSMHGASQWQSQSTQNFKPQINARSPNTYNPSQSTPIQHGAGGNLQDPRLSKQSTSQSGFNY